MPELDHGQVGTITVPTLDCPYETCGHKWIPRVPNPLRCPRCRRLLDVEAAEKREAVRLVNRGGDTATNVTLSEVIEDVPA